VKGVWPVLAAIAVVVGGIAAGVLIGIAIVWASLAALPNSRFGPVLAAVAIDLLAVFGLVFSLRTKKIDGLAKVFIVAALVGGLGPFAICSTFTAAVSGLSQ